MSTDDVNKCIAVVSLAYIRKKYYNNNVKFKKHEMNILKMHAYNISNKSNNRYFIDVYEYALKNNRYIKTKYLYKTLCANNILPCNSFNLHVPLYINDIINDVVMPIKSYVDGYDEIKNFGCMDKIFGSKTVAHIESYDTCNYKQIAHSNEKIIGNDKHILYVFTQIFMYSCR